MSKLIQFKILAYISAYVNGVSADVISFDTDAKEAICDTGCSRTLTFDLNDFISYKPSSGEVEGSGKHNIVGVGTVKYTVVTDSGNTTDIIIHDVIYVPTLNVRLLSIQQLCQQTLELKTEAVVGPTHLILRWGKHVKSVPYNGTSNFPVLCTVPGAQRATAHISKHLSPWNKAYLIRDKINTKWDHNLNDGSSEILPPELESTILSSTSNLNTDVVKPSPQTCLYISTHTLLVSH